MTGRLLGVPWSCDELQPLDSLDPCHVVSNNEQVPLFANTELVGTHSCQVEGLVELIKPWLLQRLSSRRELPFSPTSLFLLSPSSWSLSSLSSLSSASPSFTSSSFFTLHLILIRSGRSSEFLTDSAKTIINMVPPQKCPSHLRFLNFWYPKDLLFLLHGTLTCPLKINGSKMYFLLK